MNRDIFRRGVRMTHEFGGLEEMHDPSGRETFTPQFPVEPQQHSAPITTQEYGIHQHPWNQPKNGVQKPGGSMASFQGPAPDPQEGCFTIAVASTTSSKKPYKRRSGD
jgi:hypothetical protein